jgi:hypothetical protein|nr:MAG TPA: Paired amphipathic helix protein [Crassvirales sp.]
MYGYPAGSPYQSFQAPLTKENQLRMLEGQIEALKSMGSSTPQYSLLEEINTFSSNLTEDEKKLIEKSPEYSEAKSSFESGFMSFLGSKFSSEYVATPQGKVAGERLLEVIKDVKSKAQQEIAAKQEKLQKVADLLDKHPELLDKIK